MTNPPRLQQQPIDPLLQARLEQLGARNATAAPTKSPAKAGRRAKPARAAKLASLALSAATTLGLAGMFASQSGQTDSIVLTQGTAADTLPSTLPSTTLATTATTATTTSATTTAVPAATGAVVDGTYVGAADTNKWGTVQVQVVYFGGQITDVQILSYPDGERKSVSINQRALPTLISDSIITQSAEVNSVSGATYTWRSYKLSLQSAIDAAKAASGITG